MGTRREQGAADTRERILETAAKMFVQRGFDATSVSKGALLEQLLAEPLARTQQAVQEAALLSGRARTRRIVVGLLEALEVHNGVAVTALRQAGSIDVAGRALVAETRPMVYGLLLPEVAQDDADLRVRMLVGAVERVVIELMNASAAGDEFVAELRARREAIVDLAMRLVD